MRGDPHESARTTGAELTFRMTAWTVRSPPGARAVGSNVTVRDRRSSLAANALVASRLGEVLAVGLVVGTGRLASVDGDAPASAPNEHAASMADTTAMKIGADEGVADRLADRRRRARPVEAKNDTTARW
jgi:hypothetical protein